jgi:hypothetical protein
VGNLIVAAPGQVALACGTYGASPIAGTFTNNDAFASGGSPYSSCVSQTGANGNISADPALVNPAGGNYRLQSTSPAINAGDPRAPELSSTDLDGNPRTRNGKVDMGAYEYPGPATSTFSPTTLTFSQQAVGTSSAIQAVTISNNGSTPLQFSSITITNDFTQTNTCPTGSGLAPGASCIIAVTFVPTDRGTRQGTLTILSNATGSPNVITLSGASVGSAMNLSTNTLTFPNQAVNTDSAAQQITVSSAGDYPLTVSNVAATAEFSQTTSCNTAVATGASCIISVVFHPVASGTRTGSLTITSNSVGGLQVVNLAGNGQAPVPILSSLSPSSASTGGAAFTLTVQGSNFILNSVVRWNGSDCSTTFVSTAQLTAAVRASCRAPSCVGAATIAPRPS